MMQINESSCLGPFQALIVEMRPPVQAYPDPQPVKAIGRAVPAVVCHGACSHPDVRAAAFI